MLASLHSELRAPLLRYLSALGLAPADREDVLQEAFLRLLRHLHAEKPQSNLRGWLFRVSHNLALKRRPVPLPLTADSIDPAPNPEQLVAAKVLRLQLLAVVNALAERDRRCLFLRADGLSYREIAAATNMSLGAVAASLARSLSKLAAVEAR